MDKQNTLCSGKKYKQDKKDKKKEAVNPYLCERDLQVKKLPDGTVKCK